MGYMLVASPAGPLTLFSEAGALCSVGFGNDIPDGIQPDPTGNREAARQLEEYFSGVRRRFELRLAPRGTPFQYAVWSELQRIPYAETRTYGEIAAAIGRPGAARAVGAANHSNPLAIVVPCHRVIGSNGALTGYAGGLDVKERLLTLERSSAAKERNATETVRGRSTAAVG